MAKQGHQAWSTGHNGPDPNITGRQCDENKSSYDDSNFGDGLAGGGGHHSDQDPVSGYSRKFLSQVNYIDSASPDYAGNPSNERITVDPSKSDRGKEA